MTLKTAGMCSMLGLLRPRHLLLATFSLALIACSGGTNDDKIRIGSGQDANSGTTGSADFPIFYVKRSTPDMAAAAMNNLDDVRRLRVFNTNADLYMRDQSSVSAAEHNITARVHPANERWDVKDVDVSADGTRVIFAMRGPLTDNQEDKDPPFWNIWEYSIAADTLHRIVPLGADAGHDVSPHYLPAGQILFSSTRQVGSRAVLTQSEGRAQFEAQDENRDESAFVLHVMDGDGANIRQISFNQSHDMDPTVLSDGRVLFSRWDHAAGRNGVHFYTANPDGTNTQLLYGSASHNTIPDTDTSGVPTYPTVQFTKPHEMPDGRILTLVRPFTGTEYGGDLYVIDTNTYVENNQAAAAGSGATGPASRKSTPGNVRLINVPSPGGRFVSAAPMRDGTGRLLASWSQCRLIDPATSQFVPCTTAHLADPAFVSAPPVYGVWVFNPNKGTQQPVVPPVDGVMVTDIVVAQPRTAPAFRPVSLSGNTALNQTLRGEGVGILDIRSVYDFDGVAGATGTGCSIAADANPADPTCYPDRPARFLRIEKAVSLPDRDVRDIDNNAFGATNFMREILGYVPIEPDGSVRVKVPGDVAFQVSVVDAAGRWVGAFPHHNAWLSIRAGETVQCAGCHANSVNVPAGQSGHSHGRSGSFASIYPGAISGGMTFINANLNFTASNTGDTMAQARAAWSCANEQCASITPSVNVAFADVWPSTADPKVVPTAVRAGDFVLAYNGTGGLTTTVPVKLSSCYTTAWTGACRITINYLDHIQPLWERPALRDADGNGVINDGDKCIACHSRAGAAQVPAGQLELDNIPADNEGDQGNDNNLRIKSYQDLLFTSKRLKLTGTTLVFVCRVPALDANGVPIPGQCVTFSTWPAPLVARNARGSRFFNVFETNQCLKQDSSMGTCSLNHIGLLTPGELRLISEWVDIGAQYYNDPFEAPVN